MENSKSFSANDQTAAETRIIAETMLQLGALVYGKPPPVLHPATTSTTPRLSQPSRIVVHDSLPPVAPIYSSANSRSTTTSASKKPKTPKMGVKRPRARPAPVQPVAPLYPSGSIFYPSMDDYFAMEARLRAAEARNIQLRNVLNVFFGDRQDLHQFFEPTERLIWYYCESLHFGNLPSFVYDILNWDNKISFLGKRNNRKMYKFQLIHAVRFFKSKQYTISFIDIKTIQNLFQISSANVSV